MNRVIKTGIELLLVGSLTTAIACGSVDDGKKETDNGQLPDAKPIIDHELFYNPLSDNIPINFDSGLEEAMGFKEQQAFRGIASLALTQLYSINAGKGYPRFPDGVSELTVKVKKEYELPNRNLADFIHGSNKMIQNLKDYLFGVELNWPNIEYVIPTSDSEVREGLVPNHTPYDLSRNVKIYLVEDVTNVAEFSVEMLYGNTVEVFNVDIDLGSASLGEVRTDMVIEEKDGLVESQFNYSHVLLVLGPDGAISTTVVAEYLHAATAHLIEAHENKLRSNGTPFGSDIATVLREDMEAFNRARLLNEFLMHAYEGVWGRLYKESNPDNIILGGGRGGAWQDNPNVKSMAKFIGIKGPEYVFGLYQTDPEKLIVESGVNMR